MGDRVHQLLEAGQSVWLDFLGRDLIRSGQLQQLADDRHLTGITSNPSIFNKAITGSELYRDDLDRLSRDGVNDAYEAFVALASEDIRAACDALAPEYQRSAGADGFVSFELPPGIENDEEASVAEAHRLRGLIDRPNLMIKVPGTQAGARILRRLIADGLNINQTLLFSVDVYEQSANAYIEGLEERLESGQPVQNIGSVASFFVSRVDTAVDDLLPPDSQLRGTAAIANARQAYGRFQSLFRGPRWEQLAAAGARVQRPLWASTSTKNPAYRDVMYVETLVAPDTVNTLPAPTLDAVLDHAEVRPMTADEIAAADGQLRALQEAGVDIRAVTDRLLVEGLAAFENDFRSLLAALASVLGPAPSRA